MEKANSVFFKTQNETRMGTTILRQDQSIDLKIVEGAEGISEFGDDWDDIAQRLGGAAEAY